MRPAAELLLVEARALPPVLARATSEQLDLPTVCAPWSVRDVVAHCGAALADLVAGTLGGFTPEENQRAVDERASWPFDRVVDELVSSYEAAASIIDRAGGRADGLGLGEWVHGGDVRDPLGQPDAYASAGIDLAIPLISERSVERGAPALEVAVDGREISFGVGEPRGRLESDAATFVRFVAGRRPQPDRYELRGDVTVEELLLFS